MQSCTSTCICSPSAAILCGIIEYAAPGAHVARVHVYYAKPLHELHVHEVIFRAVRSGQHSHALQWGLAGDHVDHRTQRAHEHVWLSSSPSILFQMQIFDR